MKKLFIALIISISTIGAMKAQGGISISNFNAEKTSNSELLVTVDYSFSREVDTKNMVIQAFPIMKNGKANYKAVNFDSQGLEVGDHHASFKISKKTGGKGFSSEGIRVCMINMKSIIMCEEFPFEMSWYEPKTVPPTKSFPFL